MALTHLVDTSVLTRLRRQEVRRVVEPLAQTGQIAAAVAIQAALAMTLQKYDELFVAALQPA